MKRKFKVTGQNVRKGWKLGQKESVMVTVDASVISKIGTISGGGWGSRKMVS